MVVFELGLLKLLDGVAEALELLFFGSQLLLGVLELFLLLLIHLDMAINGLF